LGFFIHQPFFKPEVARTSFIKGQLMSKLGKVSESRPYKETAFGLYYELYPQALKRTDVLTRKDFDELVMFWSR
jgi:hypothetical protein